MAADRLASVSFRGRTANELAAGLELAFAMDADSATAQVAGFAPDLILMDIQLPGPGGLPLAGRFKADPASRHIMIIAFAMKGDEARMLAAGCDS